MLVACSTDNRPYRIGVSQCGAGRWRDKVNQELLAAQHLYNHDVKVSIAEAHATPTARYGRLTVWWHRASTCWS